ncbi:MAG: hypothetical protein H6Q41_2045 [Deltaproteobacteria bacterium]|nr:hypothetical protein [Deltaproteobacteria bacterium]
MTGEKGKRQWFFACMIFLLAFVPRTGYGADITISDILTTNGDWTLNGVMTATSFSGNGSGLSNVTASGLSCSGCVSQTQINTSQVQTRVGSSCATGSSIRAINSDGTVVCQTDDNSGGTVTSVGTGAGLSGGPVTTTGTISVDFTGSTGSANSASRSDHYHNNYLQYGNVAVVALSNGDYTDPVAAMSDLSTWCGTPSATNPCLLKIMPGVYDVYGSALQMLGYVDIEGSGENTTKIKGYIDSSLSGVVIGASNAEIRFLTVENSGGGATKIAIYNISASPKITNVKATASTGYLINYGVYNISSSPTMTNVTATASGGNTTCAGVYNTSSSPAMTNVTATASGGSNWNVGVFNVSSSSPTMVNVTASASGAFSYGVYNSSSSPLMMNVTATSSGGGPSGSGIRNYSSSAVMMNVKAIASGSTLENCGVNNESSSPQMTNVIATGSGGSDTYGVRNDASSPTMTGVSATGSGGSMYNRGVYSRTSGIVTINHSIIAGSLQAILNNADAITRVGNTKLDGGPVTGGGVTCAGVYDENYTFYANTCP